MEKAQEKSEQLGVKFELSEEYLAREKELQGQIDALSGQIKKNEKVLEDLADQEWESLTVWHPNSRRMP